MANIVPEGMINFKVYRNSIDMLGIAEGTLPNLEAMTHEVKGAGLAGVVDSPVLGHYNSITLSLTWRRITGDIMVLNTQQTHDLDLYHSLKGMNAGLGQYTTEQLHIYCKAIPKTLTTGNLVVGDVMGTHMEFELPYIKVSLGGKTRIEIDKYNYICKIDGVDYLAGVRSDLGMQ